MGIVRSIKGYLRAAIDWFYCRSLDSKQNIGTTDNWFILTDQLQNAIVYSGGVGKDITFELALAKKYGAHIFLFDPSPTGANTIKSLEMPANIKFYPVGLAERDSVLNFSPPVNPKEGSYRLGEEGGIQFQCRSLSSLFKEHKHEQIELLKIDIEGFEYEVINDIVSNHLKIRQIAVEFHDFYSNIHSSKTREAVALLKRHGYTLFHKRGHDYSFVKQA